MEEIAITKHDNTTVPVSTYNVSYVHSTTDGSINTNGNLQLSVTNADKNIGSSGTLTIRKLWDGKVSYTHVDPDLLPPSVSGKVYLTCLENPDHNTSVNFSFPVSTGTTSIPLPLKDSSGHFYRFRIEEDLADSSFRPVYQSFTTTDNVNFTAVIDNVCLRTRLDGVKRWVPSAPVGTTSIRIQLYRNGVAQNVFVYAYASNGWTYSFTDLDRYDPDGNPYIYSVKEAAEIQGYTAHNSGNDLVNVSKSGESTEIVAALSKTWANSNFYALHYPAVSIDLVDVTAGNKVIYTWNIPAGNATTVGRVLSLSDLIGGSVIDPAHTYKLVENSILKDDKGDPLWSFSYNATWGGSGRFLIISGTNTLLGHLEEIPVVNIDLRVSKLWEGENDLSAADKAFYAQAHKATFELYRDGLPTGTTLTMSSGTQAFTELPKFDPTDGHEYVYSVVETSINDAYIGTHAINANGTWVFTNTLKKLSTNSSTYTKYFDFGGLNEIEIGERLPANATLTFQLKRKKISQDDSQFSLVETRTLTRAEYIGSISGFLQIAFSNLPQFSPYVSASEPSEQYVYKLEEVSIPAVDGKPIFSVQYAGNRITNKFIGETPKAAVSVTKNWAYSPT